MKDTLKTKNSFRSADIEGLKKAVTEKISRIAEHKEKKTG